ncbi:sulfatase family protein [Membranihabitans maritimus]|uniref:sulfatase family protein n=1 Tax=Membranihabitans maritimus TaxID=2904244 RepID=UPI001F25C48D|nr:sulfatase [Membranihabitans maritimus]
MRARFLYNLIINMVMVIVLRGQTVSSEGLVNVVLFVADDLGAHDIGPYGNVVVRTPNLDHLASRSMLFSNAFAASPTCSPSRAALLTGLMPFRNGAHANHTGIRDGIPTLPFLMQQMGYKTAIAGKYHIGPKEAYPFEMIHHTNVQEPGYEGKGVLWTDLNMRPVEEWLADVSIGDSPFLLIVNDHSPHVIWPESTDYDPSAINVPERHIDTRETRESRARYYTDITKMDRNVGRLLNALEANALDDNTVVIFTSDQGPQWAFGKWNLYDYGVKVPLLVRWPEVSEERSTSAALVSLIDVLPTVVEIAGGVVPGNPSDIDGKSFLSILKKGGESHREEVFASHTGDGTMNRSPMRMIRTRKYKYILNLAPEIEYTTHMDKSKNHDGGRQYWDSWVDQSFETKHAAWVLWRYHNRPDEELYDIENDPGETRNLAANIHYSEILKSFRSQMNTWRKTQEDSETGPYDASKIKTRKQSIPYIFE